MSLAPNRFAFLQLVLLACGPVKDDGLGSGSTNTDTTPHDPTMTGGGEESTGVEEPYEPSFVEEPDGGSYGFECSTWAQDCPPGEKCNMWANDGGSSWNATKCTPIDPNPDDLGEACTVVGNGVSGEDSCVAGAMCWDVDPETHEGFCVAFCQGTAANPTCPDPHTFCIGTRFPLCFSTCCPVEQDCPEGQACYPTNEDFTCAPDASGPDMGVYGDPCEFINVCDAGLACVAADLVPGCLGQSCCAPYCTVGSSDCDDVHPNVACVPWYEEGQAPPGFELVGMCLLPG